MNQKTYLDQHASIKEELEILKQLNKKNNLEETAKDIALHINVLAGKLNIHLIYEDRYLYPELMELSDIRISTMAKDYKQEMGGLEQAFTAFKQKYHIPSNIIANKAGFATELRNVLQTIETRIQKEENGLYKEYFK